MLRRQTSQTPPSATTKVNSPAIDGRDSENNKTPSTGITQEMGLIGKDAVGIAHPELWRLQEAELESIMEKIRQEVQAKKNGNNNSSTYITVEHNQTKFFKFIKGIQSLLKGLPFFNDINKAALKFKPLVKKYKAKKISTKDLTILDGEEFIKRTYLEILGRNPDPDGQKYYLHLLKNGNANKIQIIGKIRYSREGKQMGVKVKGFPWKYVMGIFYQR